jgi:hypothetical protein
MTPEQRKSMQQALDALTRARHHTSEAHKARQQAAAGLRAELAKPAQGWMPIESAPKRDDVQILTFHADFLPKNGRNKLQKESCCWYQTSFWSEKFGLFVGWPLNIQPTRWMPLPLPPIAAESTQ